MSAKHLGRPRLPRSRLRGLPGFVACASRAPRAPRGRAAAPAPDDLRRRHRASTSRASTPEAEAALRRASGAEASAYLAGSLVKQRKYADAEAPAKAALEANAHARGRGGRARRVPGGPEEVRRGGRRGCRPPIAAPGRTWRTPTSGARRPIQRSKKADRMVADYETFLKLAPKAPEAADRPAVPGRRSGSTAACGSSTGPRSCSGLSRRSCAQALWWTRRRAVGEAATSAAHACCAVTRVAARRCSRSCSLSGALLLRCAASPAELHARVAAPEARAHRVPAGAARGVPRVRVSHVDRPAVCATVPRARARARRSASTTWCARCRSRCSGWRCRSLVWLSLRLRALYSMKMRARTSRAIPMPATEAQHHTGRALSPLVTRRPMASRLL